MKTNIILKLKIVLLSLSFPFSMAFSHVQNKDAASFPLNANQQICGISVANNEVMVYDASEFDAAAFVRASFNVDDATLSECPSSRGSIFVGQYKNGEVRAVIPKL